MSKSPGILPQKLSNAIQEIQSICDGPRSKSHYFEYGSQGYKDSIRHFLASSSQVAQLAVQPGSTRDLGEIMKVLKKYQVAFAVKGGGHGMAPTFSSTIGIHISMVLFSKVVYDAETQLVQIGAGCLWDQVYSKLAASGRNVIGGASADGVGVAGWLLGGGYSLKSNRYGLGIDHIIEYEIVTPDGFVRTVKADTERTLFQALRGGGNNFGIVTKFTLKTYAQNPTYGALLVVPGKRAEEVKDAIVDFVDNESRQEACVIAAFRHRLVRAEVEYNISVLCVFDAEKPKRDVPFREFKRLQKGGDVWKADPAGWKLGQTELSINDSSSELTKLKSPRRLPKSNSRGNLPVSFSLMRLNTSQASLDDDETYQPSEDEDDDSLYGTFEEISHDRLYRVSPQALDVFEEDNDDRDDYWDNYRVSNGYDNESNDNESTLYEESDADEDKSARGFTDNRMLSVASLKSSALKLNLKVNQPPQRTWVTKNVDKMGELNDRGRFGCLMISKYTKELLDKMAEEAEKSASYLKSRRGLSVIVDAWPVHPSIFDNSPPGAAFPHDRGKPYGPMLVYFRWEDEKDDDFWITKLKGTLNRIRVVARRLGLTPTKPALYNNLTLETVPVHKIYRENMNWLKQVKAEYDPEDVMGKAGGHKIPLPGKKDREPESSSD